MGTRGPYAAIAGAHDVVGLCADPWCAGHLDRRPPLTNRQCRADLQQRFFLAAAPNRRRERTQSAHCQGTLICVQVCPGARHASGCAVVNAAAAAPQGRYTEADRTAIGAIGTSFASKALVQAHHAARADPAVAAGRHVDRPRARMFRSTTGLARRACRLGRGVGSTIGSVKKEWAHGQYHRYHGHSSRRWARSRLIASRSPSMAAFDWYQLQRES